MHISEFAFVYTINILNYFKKKKKIKSKHYNLDLFFIDTKHILFCKGI